MPGEGTIEPEVIFDVVFEDGLLFFELSNRAPVPVTKVSTVFRKPVIGPDGATELSGLALFRKIEFMPPGKAIRVFVDTVPSYFARKQPGIVHVTMSWRQGKKDMTTQIAHDIRIYRDLPYVIGRGESARRSVPANNQPNGR